MQDSLYPKPAPPMASGHHEAPIEVPEKPAKTVGMIPEDQHREVFYSSAANGAGADSSSCKDVACAPCKPLTYTVAVYLLVFEGVFAFLFLFLSAFLLFMGLPSILLCGLGLPLMWCGLWFSRVSAKFAAWCYSGLGARVPVIEALPARQPGFFGIFRCSQSWRAALFTVLVRPVVGNIVIFCLKMGLLIGLGAAIAPIIALVAAARGVTPGWTIAVAAIACPVGLLCLYVSICLFPAAAGFLAWVLTATVGHPPNRGTAAPLVGVPTGHANYSTNADGAPVGQFAYAKVDGQGMQSAAVEMYTSAAAERAVVPSRRRRGFCHACGTVFGCVVFALVTLAFLAVAGQSVLTALVAVNCYQADDVYDNTTTFVPAASLPATVAVLTDAGLPVDVRYTNEMRWLGNISTIAPDPAAVGMRVTARAYGSLSTFNKYFAPRVGPPSADDAVTTAGVVAAVGKAGMHDSFVGMVDRWLLCATARVVVVVPDTVIDDNALAQTTLRVHSESGIFSTEPHHEWWGADSDGATDARPAPVRGFAKTDVWMKYGAVVVEAEVPTNGVAHFEAKYGEARLPHLRLHGGASVTVESQYGEARVDKAVLPLLSDPTANLTVYCKHGNAQVKKAQCAWDFPFGGVISAKVNRGHAKIKHLPEDHVNVLEWNHHEKVVEVESDGHMPHRIFASAKYGDAKVELYDFQ
eukprot:TRINITY_DN2646_c0_g1_i1.p1 TRINITY_DN2646_c0_g1~~TRINITY_DN2646_c0_g1_i1.p1  ORF type:complete len:693 (-),score=139.92 TRINITY_DN2646_c0_g1_i1:765-2843(-)